MQRAAPWGSTANPHSQPVYLLDLTRTSGAAVNDVRPGKVGGDA
jgi:hypothetical protein